MGEQAGGATLKRNKIYFLFLSNSDDYRGKRYDRCYKIDNGCYLVQLFHLLSVIIITYNALYVKWYYNIIYSISKIL